MIIISLVLLHVMVVDLTWWMEETETVKVEVDGCDGDDCGGGSEVW